MACAPQFSDDRPFDRDGRPSFYYSPAHLLSDPEEQPVNLRLRSRFGMLQDFDCMLQFVGDCCDRSVAIAMQHGHVQQAVRTGHDNTVGQAAKQMTGPTRRNRHHRPDIHPAGERSHTVEHDT